MSDIIRLLPDSVANQIAAGEVIQRPASVVKELMENSIDSGAAQVELIIKDAGKTLIQVIDNGCGMSPTDARLSFERHATSKITSANDLFKLNTFGFRGEALASIAAIAHIEMKTRPTDADLGACLIVEGSKTISQEPVACQLGTSIAVKNLFFNVPARRNFLKSDNIEMRHIIDEFQRVALVYPSIIFTMHNNNKVVFQLPKGSLKQRIINLMGNTYNEKLIEVSAKTNVVNLSGFIGKPECSRKTRGDQFFFANNRFIKHPYFNHAVVEAYSDLIPEGNYPSYFLFIEVEPESIDVNIHPTKTEVNFQEQQVIFSIIRSAVKQSIGKNNLTSMLDFDAENSFKVYFPKDKDVVIPQIKVNPNFNPFDNNDKKNFSSSNASFEGENLKNWEQIYDLSNNKTSIDAQNPKNSSLNINANFENENSYSNTFIQLQNKYILTKVKSGLLIINQQLAHERILYESLLSNNKPSSLNSQQLLFKAEIELSNSDSELLEDLLSELKNIGFQIEKIKQGLFSVSGVPIEFDGENIQEIIESSLESYKNNLMNLNFDKSNNIIKSMAQNMALKKGATLKKEEMQALVDNLFSCSLPNISPSGKIIFYLINIDEIEKRFL